MQLLSNYIPNRWRVVEIGTKAFVNIMSPNSHIKHIYFIIRFI